MVELLGLHTWMLGVVYQASVAVRMSTCESYCYLCLGPVRGVYQDISQAAFASMCNYRWSWEDCCNHRLSREDLKVVKQNVLNARTQGVVCQDQRNPLFSHTIFSSASWRVMGDTPSQAFCSESEG